MATQQVVNVGSQANDATGDLLRDAFTKINTNFSVFFAGNFPTAQMTIGPPVSGNALTAVGISGSAAIVATAFSVTDISLTASGTASFAGGVTFGSPTGGNKGAGSFNAASGFINNVAVFAGTPVTTFTSNTGLSTNVAATGAVTVTNTGVVSLAGTANQIAVSASTGTVTLTLPQNVIVPTPSTGAGLVANGAASGTGLFVSNNGAQFADGNTYAFNVRASTNGVRIHAGTGAGNNAFVITDAADGNNSLVVNGAGAVSIGNPSAGLALTVTGSSAGIAAMAFATMATTGAQAVVLNITNKPGASGQTTPAKWLPVSLDGSTYYIPAFS